MSPRGAEIITASTTLDLARRIAPMAEKHRMVQSRERIDSPPTGRPGEPGPEWAIADHEAESDPEADPEAMPRPLTHDDT